MGNFGASREHFDFIIRAVPLVVADNRAEGNELKEVSVGGFYTRRGGEAEAARGLRPADENSDGDTRIFLFSSGGFSKRVWNCGALICESLT